MEYQVGHIDGRRGIIDGVGVGEDKRICAGGVKK